MSNIKKFHLAVWTPEAIKEDQNGIKSDLTGLDQRIHLNAVHCLLHCSIHRDTSLMRRLLIDVIDTKTGYRRAGLINWVRKFSPMELKQDTINLSGLQSEAGILSMAKQFPGLDMATWGIAGKERPFLVEQAFNTPFWTDKDNNEMVVKPVYREQLMSKIALSMKEFRAAIANTANGEAIDVTKPFYDGLHSDKVIEFYNKLEVLLGELPADSTKVVRSAQQQIREAIVADPTAAALIKPEKVLEGAELPKGA
jgi:hypothetical protein